MKCPYCGHQEDRVLDSRPLEAASIIRRRRECQACHKRFTTYERLEEVPLMVIKSNERREPFNREKLREGILRDPQVTVLVDQYADVWNALWWVRIRGDAEVHDVVSAEAVAALSDKYEQYRQHPPSGPAIVVRVHDVLAWNAGG